MRSKRRVLWALALLMALTLAQEQPKKPLKRSISFEAIETSLKSFQSELSASSRLSSLKRTHTCEEDLCTQEAPKDTLAAPQRTKTKSNSELFGIRREMRNLFPPAEGDESQANTVHTTSTNFRKGAANRLAEKKRLMDLRDKFVASSHPNLAEAIKQREASAVKA